VARTLNPQYKSSNSCLEGKKSNTFTKKRRGSIHQNLSTFPHKNFSPIKKVQEWHNFPQNNPILQSAFEQMERKLQKINSVAYRPSGIKRNKIITTGSQETGGGEERDEGRMASVYCSILAETERLLGGGGEGFRRENE
jgi:hypothetical protein